MPVVPGLKPPSEQLSASEEKAGYLACGLSALTKAVPLWVTVLSLQFLESCDEVILLEDGEICEKGTHRELMEERGRYAKLIHNLRGLQFKVTTGACGDVGSEWGVGLKALPHDFPPRRSLSLHLQK